MGKDYKGEHYKGAHRVGSGQEDIREKIYGERRADLSNQRTKSNWVLFCAAATDDEAPHMERVNTTSNDILIRAENLSRAYHNRTVEIFCEHGTIVTEPQFIAAKKTRTRERNGS